MYQTIKSRRIIFMAVFLAVIVALASLISGSFVYGAKAQSRSSKIITTAKTEYYTTNKYVKNKTYKDSGIKGVYKEYLDKNKKIRKILMYPGNGDMDIAGYTVEYYYNKSEKLVFAFAYKKVKGKLKKYRAYYGTDGKVYRYINYKGKTYTYKNGLKASKAYKMPKLMYSKGMWNIDVAYGG